MDSKRMRELAGISPEVVIETGTLLEMVHKPKPGQKFGKNDRAEPKKHTTDELSRIADLLHCAHQVGDKALSQQVFKLLPDSAKLEFNRANWEYVAPKR